MSTKRVIPVVAAVIVNNDLLPKFLVKLRKRCESRACKSKDIEGKYEFPGGKIEYGETPEKALQREVLEELGEKIIVLKLLHAQSNIYQNGRHWLILYYECNFVNNVVLLDGCRWMSMADADVPVLPGTYEAITKVMEERSARRYL